jgi:transcriptional regulator with XRE-family HTH domain
MSEEQKTTPEPFGRLVNAKLKELGMSQAELGRRIFKGAAYMSYLVRGTTNSYRGKKFRPSREVVMLVARELGIPVDEALLSAGHDPALNTGRDNSTQAPPPARRETPLTPDRQAKPDQTLFEIANQGALDALARHAGLETNASTDDGITIDLGDGASLTLNGAGNDLTKDEIANLKLAFRVAYRTVRQTGQS